MYSEYKVTSCILGNEKVWRVYRNIDVNEPDHAGNREYREEIFATEEAAEEIAWRWNTSKTTDCPWQ